jgi:DNA-binding MarR family transcriptional regulator
MLPTKLMVEKIVKIIPEFEYLFGRPMKLVTKNTLTNYQSKVLTVLQIVPEISMTELADRLVMLKPQLTANVDVLVKLDFVERVFDESDRRKIKIRLSAQGRQYLEETKQKMAKYYDTFFDKMTEAEYMSLYSSMETMLSLLQKLNPLAHDVDLNKLGNKQQ